MPLNVTTKPTANGPDIVSAAIIESASWSGFGDLRRIDTLVDPLGASERGVFHKHVTRTNLLIAPRDTITTYSKLYEFAVRMRNAVADRMQLQTGCGCSYGVVAGITQDAVDASVTLGPLNLGNKTFTRLPAFDVVEKVGAIEYGFKIEDPKLREAIENRFPRVISIYGLTRVISFPSVEIINSIDPNEPYQYLYEIDVKKFIPHFNSSFFV